MAVSFQCMTKSTTNKKKIKKIKKEYTCNVRHTGDVGSVPVSGRSPGGENSNPLQYSCLGNPMDRGGWWATIHGVTKSK